MGHLMNLRNAVVKPLVKLTVSPASLSQSGYVFQVSSLQHSQNDAQKAKAITTLSPLLVAIRALVGIGEEAEQHNRS